MPLLTVAEVKDHLNITDATNEAELASFIARAESALVTRTGPIVPVPVTARVRGFTNMLSPVKTPILTLTSVTPVGGTAITPSLLHTPDKGPKGPNTIEFLDGSGFYDRWYDVVYTSGRDPIPEDLKEACLEAVRYYWQPQLGNAPGALPVEDEQLTLARRREPFSAGDFPWDRVQHLVEPYEQWWA